MAKIENESIQVLNVEHLSKSFENVHAVNDVSFHIKKGEVYGLLGPNGAGKTTTIKQILGLLTPDNGNISILGLHPERDEIEVKKRIGYIAEEPLIYKSLTPKELFNFIASIRRITDPKITERLAQYLDSLGAIEYYERLISTLSRGNKQKIQIIAAFLHNPDLLIMDEPLAGLDAKSVKVVKEMVELHTQRGGAVLFSTHIMEVAEDLCDRIGIISQGKLLAEGTIQDLRDHTNMIDDTLDLEDIFLRITEQDESVNLIIDQLRKTMQAA
ncbi:ABC transporter ATP-binding protein [Candidatus Lokiarchaeum ossiferum]|uniref:ABC transporter ATP-binding protein n=1 Tax=Candidatus Lokiarchaeum ossiferum TaxID=2951803 RepID=UPI00352F332A